MPHVARSLLHWVVGLALVCGFAAGSAGADVYRYVDDRGVTHYSDQIESVPFAYRDQLVEMSGELEGPGGIQVLSAAGAGKEAPGPSEESTALSVDLDGSGAVEALTGAVGSWLIVIVLLAVPLFVAIGGMVLKLACRIAGADPPTLGRACAILFAQSIVGSIAGGLLNIISIGGGGEGQSLWASLGVAAASGTLSWVAGAAVLNGMTGYGMPRALWVGVIHTGLVLVLILGPIAGVVGVLWLTS